MAVWQYELNIIPKFSILEKYGEIPNKIFIDEDGWKKYWENINSHNEFINPEFEDARTIKWWKNINIHEIANKIDKLVKRGDWSNNKDYIGWKGNTEEQEDNDCSIFYNENTLEIIEFNFRTDLRNLENAQKFMEGMLKICNENNLLVMNNNGFLFQPKLELILEDIKISNATMFLIDPIKFIEEIDNNEENRSLSNTKINDFWNKIRNIFN